MKAAPGATLMGINGHLYTADADGLIANVETHDIATLQEQGAGTTSVSPFKHLKLFVTHALYFEGRTHKADANGILRNVPRDHAAPLIESGAAREATDDELTAEPAFKAAEIALVPLNQSLTGLPITVVPVPAPVPVIEPATSVDEPALTVVPLPDPAPVIEPVVVTPPAIDPPAPVTEAPSAPPAPAPLTIPVSKPTPASKAK